MRMSSAAAEATEKSAEAFRTISEVSLELDVPQHVLRFWESRFQQVRPIKRAGGRRYYRPEDVALLRGIRALLYVDGMTIKGVQKVLRDKGLRYVSEIGRGEASLHGKPAKGPREKFHRQLRAVDFTEETPPAKIPETQKNCTSFQTQYGRVLRRLPKKRRIIKLLAQRRARASKPCS